MNRCGGSIFTVFSPSLEAKWRTKTFAMNIHGLHNHNNYINMNYPHIYFIGFPEFGIEYKSLKLQTHNSSQILEQSP